MIYEKIEAESNPLLNPIIRRLTEIRELITTISEAAAATDSKSREEALKEEIRFLIKERHGLWGKQEQIRTEVFKNLLEKEYDLPRNHPKFEAVFSLAWQHGHGSGYSDVETCFSEFVELVK